MTKHWIQTPIKGYELTQIEAETMDEALAIVKAEGFSNEEDEDGATTYPSMQAVGYGVWKEAQPANEIQLEMVRGFYEET